MPIIDGSCHCGNLAFEVTTGIAADAIRARACDCSFCRIHGAKNWSDPSGGATIRIADSDDLQRYRFALGTADFFICRKCGAYLGAVLTDGEGCWSTVNLRLTKLAIAEESASYGGEDTEGRIARRKRVWTPTRVLIAH